MKKSLSPILAVLLTTGLLNALLMASAQGTPAPQETQAAANALTNQDILAMLKAGASTDSIIARIKSSANRFDTSTAALQSLKEQSVPEALILEIARSAAGGSTAIYQQGEMVEVNIPDGTAVEVELTATASGQDLLAGDAVDFKVVQPVQVNGITIIEKDAPAKARITQAKKASSWGRAGKLEWAMQETIGVDGSRIPLRFTQRMIGDSKGGTVAVSAVATTVLMGAGGLLWGLKTGKPAIIPAGNRYTVFVHGNVSAKGKAAANTTAQTSAQ